MHAAGAFAECSLLPWPSSPPFLKHPRLWKAYLRRSFGARENGWGPTSLALEHRYPYVVSGSWPLSAPGAEQHPPRGGESLADAATNSRGSAICPLSRLRGKSYGSPWQTEAILRPFLRPEAERHSKNQAGTGLKKCLLSSRSLVRVQQGAFQAAITFGRWPVFTQMVQPGSLQGL